MNDMRLLLLSNSTNYGEDYLKWPEKYIKQFLGDAKSEILFVPYAGVCLDWDDYYDKVSNSLARIGLDVKSLHHGDEKAMIEKARVIMVGGGNSFFLLHNLQKTGVFQLIREMVLNGIPYIGWSAGANVACPTIMTTNDMPIVEPENFKGLNLVRFQINPHYTDKTISNHGGETRAERITEFLEVNSEKTVAGLPEGTLLQVEGDQLAFKGDGVLRIFRKGMPVKEAHPGDSLDWLLKS